jgi:hypothetical protein
MRTTAFYRPCAVLAKAALISDSRRCFDGVVVESDHGTVILSGVVSEIGMIGEALALAVEATGVLVINHIVVWSSLH